MIAAIIFWLSVLAMLHSYLLYPLLLKIISKGKKHNSLVFSGEEELPMVYVLMSAYNEERLVGKKLESVLKSDYPADKLKIEVGSDGSTDRTNEIVTALTKQHPNLRLKIFEDRSGKSHILNSLVQSLNERESGTGAKIFIFTDANVFFTPSAIFELVKHFKNPEIALVGANVRNTGLNREGISIQEKSYIERENYIKYLEGLNWGTMMGAFGACYAIKSDFFGFIPKNFLMEDFYITMRVLEKKGKAIAEPNAVCIEDVSDDIFMEFSRKTRISAGNYQNLGVFYKLLFPIFSPLSFSFFSHKILRWTGPFFITAAYLSCLFLARTSTFYFALLIIQSVLLIIPFFDYLLKQGGIHVMVFRFISYFYFMNLALAAGMVRYIKGIKTSTWEPTARNQI